jgi:hypothetical protein
MSLSREFPNHGTATKCQRSRKKRLQENGHFAMTAPLCRSFVGTTHWLRFVMTPPDEAVANVRRYLWIEVVMFAALPASAAAMARGYGRF